MISPTAPGPSGDEPSYAQILKSSVLTGGSQIVVILLTIVQAKTLALLLGPSGVGISGLYYSAATLAVTLFGLGLGGSAARQVAEASGMGEAERVGRLAAAVRGLSWILGVAGGLALAIFSRPLARLTFGDGSRAVGMFWMAGFVLFSIVQSGQLGVLQGLRRIRDLAACRVLGALGGALAIYPMIRLLGEDGIGPWHALAAAWTVVPAALYLRRAGLRPCPALGREVLGEFPGLWRMGIAFVTASLVAAGLAYAGRWMVVRRMGLEAAGLYQATMSISSVYVGFILQAMAMDYFPRLTGSIADRGRANRLVNEQTEIGLLLAIPGVLGTIALAPWILTVLYSKEFVPAAEVIRWQSLGILLRVVCYPTGFIMLAYGRVRLFVATEVLAAVVHLLFLRGGMDLWGLEGMGISFFAAYVVGTLISLLAARRITRFLWSRVNGFLMGAALAASGAGFAAVRFMPGAWGAGTALAVTAVSSGLCFRRIRDLVRRTAPPGPRQEEGPVDGPIKPV